MSINQNMINSFFLKKNFIFTKIQARFLQIYIQKFINIRIILNNTNHL